MYSAILIGVSGAACIFNVARLLCNGSAGGFRAVKLCVKFFGKTLRYKVCLHCACSQVDGVAAAHCHSVD